MIKKTQHIIQQLARNRWLQHFLFWAISFYVLLRFFAYENEIFKSDIIFTSLFHLSVLLVVYLNLRLLIPKILQKNKVLWYAISIVGLIVLGIKANEFTFNYLSDIIFPQYYFISYYEFQELAYFFIIYWAVSTLLKFSKAWFTLNEARKKLQRLEAEKLKAELKGLKSQVNPHFLFNALNSIYALALDNEKHTPTAILKLSEVLRYMLYESNEPTVPLEQEVKYLKDYIEVQEIRLEADAFIDFQIVGNIKKVEIAPLLLIPFVENGFKHGLKSDITQKKLTIILEVNEQQIIFKTINYKGEKDETIKSSGIGLENVKRRLDLIYPNTHELKIHEETDFFKIDLMINI